MGRRGRTYQRNVGLERAQEHIRQARALSHELGGTDKDVKEYFFNLKPAELSIILDEYESLHGKKARDYADETMADWKDGRRKMSGMVAERLFNLLPTRMPIAEKYKLVESLWRKVGPSSRRRLYVNPNVPFSELSAVVREHLERDVLSYTIPERIEARFEWLSKGDVGVKQQLLNFLREQERILAAESLRVNLPILNSHLNSGLAKHTHNLSHTLQVGKHEITITLSDKVDGITDTPPQESSWAWLGWIAAIVFLFLLFS